MMMKNWNPAKVAYENQCFNPNLGRSGQTPDPDDGRCKLFVNGIAPEISNQAFKNLFETYGKVVYNKLLPIKNSDFTSKAGFIHYGSVPEAQTAIRELNGCSLGGHTLKVAVALPKKNQAQTKFQDFVKNCDKGPLIDADVEELMKKADDKFSEKSPKNSGDASSSHQNSKQKHSSSSFQKDNRSPNNFSNSELKNGSFANKSPSKSNSIGSDDHSSFVEKKTSQSLNSSNNISHGESSSNKQSNKTVKKPCNVCGILATQYCSYCSFVYYCSQDCQRKDWRDHKLKCKKLAAKKLYQQESDFDSDEPMVCVDESLCDSVAKLMQKMVVDETSSGKSHQNENKKSPPKITKQEGISHFSSNLKEGTTMRLLVIDVDASSSFIVCQTAEQSSLKSLSKLQQELNHHCKVKPPTLLVSPAVGDICAAIFSEDNQWYRGRILELCDTNQAVVQFVDYGNSEYVDCNKIMCLDEEFCHLPAFSLLCKLAGCGVDVSWTDKQTNYLIELLQKNGMLMTAKCVEIVGQVLIAQLWINNVCINEKMKRLGPIKPVKKIEFGSPYPAQDSTDSSSNSPQSSKDLLSKERLISPPSSVKKSPHKVALPAKESPSKKSIASVQIPDGSFTAFVCHVDAPDSFYCQVVADDFLQMHNYLPQLTEFLSSQSNRRKYEPTVGDVCAALFVQDEQWYRAKVVKILNANLFTIFYVDFGNTADVARHNLQPLPDKYHALPFQAFKATLADCYPVNKQWSAHALDIFNKSLNATAEAIKRSKTEDGRIALTLYANESKTFNDHLVSLGYASKTQQGNKTVLPQRVQQQKSVVEQATLISLPAFNPPVNEKVTVVISALFKPGYFHCYLEGEASLFLKSKSSKLAQQCQNKKPPSRAVIEQGMYCAAYFEKRSEWSRAVVTNVKEALIQVRYVDYGLTAWLLDKELRVLPMDFATPPMLALPCMLADVKPTSDVWNDDFTNTIYNFLGKKTEALFVGKVDNNYVVKVPDITNILIIQNSAKYCI